MNGVEKLKSIDLEQARRLLETLFEARTYRGEAGLAPEIDAFAHFFQEGAKRGFSPNAAFDSRWYLEHSPEAARAGVNPLLHYAIIGEKLDLDPSPWFDTRWYRANHKTDTPLAHYLPRRFGPYSPIPEFDAAYYLLAYPDVGEAKLDPFLHYMHFGFREFRKPSADFNPRLYANRHLAHDRAANPIADLRARKRSGAAIADRARAPTSFDLVKLHARPGTRFESIERPATEELPDALVLAFYLTQFHRIAENDAWWGNGFTEWTQLARGQPRFAGHYQPRIPSNLGFYDLADVAVMRAQAKLAKAAGLGGFVFYYYDFDGVRLLEKPLEQFLAWPDIDIGFCLLWANENWTRRWDGAEADVLIAQTYDPARERQLCAELARHFRDPRYLRLDGRPLLMVYRASLVPDTAATVARWRRRFVDEFQENPLFVMAQCFDDVDPGPLGFDAAVEFPPHKLTKGLPQVYNQLDIFDDAFEADVFAYDDLVEASLGQIPPAFPLIKTAVPCWDNDARRQGQGLTLVGATPLKYERWLAELVARARRQPTFGRPIVCINAWNEWSEGAYLEPDVHFGAAYLNATARAVRGIPRGRTRLLALGNPNSSALAAVARRFAAGFGFDVAWVDERDVVASNRAVLALVAASAAQALPVCAHNGLRTILLLDLPGSADAPTIRRADVVAFADGDAKRGALAACGLADASQFFAGLDAIVANAPEAERLGRALFDLALPSVAKMSVFVVNRGHAFVVRTLKSIFAQTHAVAEIFVFDEASTELSFAAIDACASAADRDVTVVLDDEAGAPPWRRVLETTSGEFVWIASGEGFADPEFLSLLSMPLRADVRTALAFCDSRAVDDDGQPLRSPTPKLGTQKPRPSLGDQTYEAKAFADLYLSDDLPVPDIGAVLWRRDALVLALAAIEDPSGADLSAVLRATTTLPMARIAYVAEALNFIRAPRDF